MNTLTLNSYAKINLSLDVVGRRPDGYHEVCMVMQTINLYDQVSVTISQKRGDISVQSNLSFLPCDRRNLAYKACEIFFEKAGIKNPGIQVALQKRIPVSAGLAGGSGNAAAVLKALNSLFGTGFSTERLCAIGKRLGADVPYCLLGGTVLCEGIGEKMTRLRPLPETFLVLIKPPFSVSTPKVYAAFDQKKVTAHPDTKGLLKAIDQADLPGIAQRMYNVFSDIVAAKKKVIREIENDLIGSGAMGAVMSGSGPSVFGIFRNDAEAKKAYQMLSPKYPYAFFTKTING